ncbi:MAG: glycosyl transferase family 2 [Myxococcales bacterium]|nr:glycosyl transferase family 2 [Myxococcales bacterium]
MADLATPLVTIGIPTYRRPELLRRAVLSALAQDHPNLEVVVSDNGSGDQTADICAELARTDSRLRVLQQPVNMGPSKNFLAVLAAATGEYFMWLGDDDWLDPDYVSGCLRILSASSEISIVGGVATNYRNGKVSNVSRQKDLAHYRPGQRVMAFYRSLGNNAIVYGLMRRTMIASCVATNTLGGDWLLMAQVAFQGKMLTNPDVSIHRERENSAGSSVANTVKALGLPRVQQLFPITSVAVSAARDIAGVDAVYGGMDPTERRKLATAVGGIVLIKLGVFVRLQTVAVAVIGRERAARWQAMVRGTT